MIEIMKTALLLILYFLGLILGFILGKHANEDTKRINHSIRQGFLEVSNKLTKLIDKIDERQ